MFSFYTIFVVTIKEKVKFLVLLETSKKSPRKLSPAGAFKFCAVLLILTEVHVTR